MSVVRGAITIIRNTDTSSADGQEGWIVDIHTHILPWMDDGSGSGGESLAMLQASADQGVGCVVATPHFYACDDTPERFLSRRAASENGLRKLWRDGLPQLLLGAEVYYFEGIGRIKEIKNFRIQGTELLLLEMPFCPWTERIVSEVLELNRRAGLTVVLAHIERYLRLQKSHIWDELADAGILMQCNAEIFLRWNTRRRALRMLRDGYIQFLGSDCHNMTARPPRMGEALKVIGLQGRRTLVQYMEEYFPIGRIEA